MKTFITMQKFDGDITSIFFNLFPKIVLKNMIAKGLINKKQKEALFDLFLGKCNYTMNNSKSLSIYLNTIDFDSLISPEIHDLYIKYLYKNPQIINTTSTFIIGKTEYKNIYSNNIDNINKNYLTNKDKLDKIKSFSNISLELYDIFMDQLIELLNSYYEIIIKEMIKIKLLLIKLGYNYSDNKFDNFGYILSNVPINDFRRYDVPRIFNKYLYVYFLDWDSGLQNGDEQSLKTLIEEVNEGLKYYSLNGQYNIVNINSPKITYTSERNLTSLEINPEILKILQKSYEFDSSRFKYDFHSIEELEQFIYNKIL
jgi:hypothetical protein